MRTFFVVLALAACGCGYVGAPLPPTLHIPERVTILNAHQRAGQIVIGFVVTGKSTDELVLKQLREIDLRYGPPDPSIDKWAAGAKRIPVEIHAQTAATSFASPVAGLENRNTRLRPPRGRAHRPHWGLERALDPACRSRPARARRATHSRSGRHHAALACRRCAPSNEMARLPPEAGRGKVSRPSLSPPRPTGSIRTPPVRMFNTATRSRLSFPPAKASPKATCRGWPASPTRMFSRPSRPRACPPSPASTASSWRGSPVASPTSRLTRYGAPRVPARWSKWPMCLRDVTYSDHQIVSGKRYRYAVSASDTKGNTSKPGAPIEFVAP